MRVIVADDAEAAGLQAAALIATAAGAGVAERGRFTVAFSGGTTPVPLFTALAARPIPWGDSDIFQTDERVAPDGSPVRNAELLRTRLLDRVPSGRFHPMPVTDPDLAAAAERYARTLQEVTGDGVLDVVHLGLGADGHVASLVPGDPVLDIRDRDVACTAAYEGFQRMTLTFPVLNRARRLIWLVTGGEKAAAVRRLLQGDPAIPASGVHDARGVLVLDRAAASTMIPSTRTTEDA